MTKEQFKQRFEKLLPAVVQGLKNRANKAIASGALNLEEAEDDFRLPKIVLCAALKSEASAWRPLGEVSDDEHNLAHFI